MLEKEIKKSIIEIIDKRKEKVREIIVGDNDFVDNTRFGSDFLGVLLRAHYDTNDNQRIFFDDLVDECRTFYVVGQETTNSLLGWTVFLLASHTEWQVNVRNEVLNLFGQQNNPTPDGIAKLKIVSPNLEGKKLLLDQEYISLVFFFNFNHALYMLELLWL